MICRCRVSNALFIRTVYFEITTVVAHHDPYTTSLLGKTAVRSRRIGTVPYFDNEKTKLTFTSRQHDQKNRPVRSVAA